MNQRTFLRLFCWLSIAACMAGPATADSMEPFVVEDIEFIGLQRIPDGTVFTYLPVNVGDTVDTARIQQAIRALYETGFFDDITMTREGNSLVIEFRERPTIALFAISGNREIADEDLRRVLREIGLTEGRVLNRSVLEGMQTELQRQYFSRGRYGMQVDTTITDLPSNTVAVAIEIREGLVARIRQISFVGNDTFDDDRLRGELTLRATNWLSWLRGDDQYSRESLQGDLETLRDFYMNRGYAGFDVRSTQVAISPDKKDVFITINVEEGDVYTFGEISLAGNLIVAEDELRRFIAVSPGSTFSRIAITQSTEFMQLRLGEEGYAFAEIVPIPEFNEEERTVDVVMHVNPGSRVYVRRIEFEGGSGTDDETYRREMRQLEGAWLQSANIDRSRVRLQRLPFVESVEIDTVPVPGSEDQVDVEVEIEERNPGDFRFGLGYSSAYGLLADASLTHSNFLGRGLNTQIQLARSNYDENYVIGYTDPYMTTSGISGSVSLFYRSLDSLFVRSSPFLMDTYGGSFTAGIPISEFNRINIGLALRDTEMIATTLSSNEMRTWTTNPDHGDNFIVPDPFDPFLIGGWGTQFRTVELLAGFVTDTRNRTIFATRGHRREYSFEVAIPPSDVSYVMGTFTNESYFAINDYLTLMVRAGLSYGAPMGSTDAIPPYKHFFGGGPDSVRGYREFWLGPQDSLGRPYGGTILVFSQVEVILPPPFEAMRDNARVSLFYDVGNVYANRSAVDLGDLRMSAGLAVTWLGPLGAMKLSIAFPFRRQPGDDTERFQFTVGSAF